MAKAQAADPDKGLFLWRFKDLQGFQALLGVLLGREADALTLDEIRARANAEWQEELFPDLQTVHRLLTDKVDPLYSGLVTRSRGQTRIDPGNRDKAERVLGVVRRINEQREEMVRLSLGDMQRVRLNCYPSVLNYLIPSVNRFLAASGGPPIRCEMDAEGGQPLGLRLRERRADLGIIQRPPAFEESHPDIVSEVLPYRRADFHFLFLVLAQKKPPKDQPHYDLLQFKKAIGAPARPAGEPLIELLLKKRLLVMASDPGQINEDHLTPFLHHTFTTRYPVPRLTTLRGAFRMARNQMLRDPELVTVGTYREEGQDRDQPLNGYRVESIPISALWSEAHPDLQVDYESLVPRRYAVFYRKSDALASGWEQSPVKRYLDAIFKVCGSRQTGALANDLLEYQEDENGVTELIHNLNV